MLCRVAALIVLFGIQCGGGDLGAEDRTSVEACADLSAEEKKSCLLAGFTVFDSDDSLHFAHLCSEAQYRYRYAWSAYAFFEKLASGTKSYKALVLAEVLVGSRYGQSGLTGLGVSLEKIRIESLSEWSGAPFALALQMTNRRTGALTTGKFSETFWSLDNRSPELRPYRIAPDGSMDWEQYTEPEEASISQGQKHSESIDIYTENIPHPDDDFSLGIVLRNASSQERLMLEGPAVRHIPALLRSIKTPVSRSLGLLQTLNPFQEGGLWDFIRNARRYDGCIALRKEAKRQFRARF